jgi:XTP/dITP diphosphohydrolase
MTITFLVATKNQGKIKEFAAMLADLDIKWLGLADINETMDVAETGETFRANALLKAQAYARATGFITFADDSGLEVDALNGEPGVYTARYGGKGLSAVERYQLLLKNLAGVSRERRTARFRCAIVCCAPHGEILGESEGVCEGEIAFAPAGEGGFGYDPVFFVPEYGLTMAQLPAEEKHRISHRGRALQALLPRLMKIARG